MKRAKLKKEILDLLQEANPEINIVDDDLDMFTSSCNVASRDLLFVCMELKKKYPIDYNKVVDRVGVYSLNQFTDAISAQL